MRLGRPDRPATDGCAVQRTGDRSSLLAAQDRTAGQGLGLGLGQGQGQVAESDSMTGLRRPSAAAAAPVIDARLGCAWNPQHDSMTSWCYDGMTA